MVDITILEVHLPEGQFTVPSPVGGDTGREPEDAEQPAGEPADESTGGALAVLLVLLGLAALAWYLRGGRDGNGLAGA